MTRRRFRIPAAFAILLQAALATSAYADPAGFAAIRSDVSSAVASILGSDGVASAQPDVDDATARIEIALRAVARTDQRPRSILTLSQKIALLRARSAGTRPDLQLSPDQRRALATYARDAAGAILPIVRDDGAKIQATFSPARAAALDDLRAKTLARLAANAPNAGGLPDLVESLATTGGVLSAGDFVVLVSLDPQQIVAASR